MPPPELQIAAEPASAAPTHTITTTSTPKPAAPPPKAAEVVVAPRINPRRPPDKPQYPASERRAGHEGSVILQIYVSDTGKVTDAKTGKPIEEFELRNGFLFSNSDRTHWSGDRGIVFNGGEYSYKFDEPMEGKITLKAELRGLFKVKSRLLYKINPLTDITIASLPNNYKVEKNQGLAGVRIVPLTITESSIQKVESFSAQEGPVFQVKAYQTLQVGIITLSLIHI